MLDERWLVKSSGKVLGPFTLEELIQHLRARTVSIIDEVRDPLTRWSFVREQPVLQEVVQQLRLQQDYQNDETQSGFQITKSDTASVTENILQEGEITPGPQKFDSISDIRPISGQEVNISSGGINSVSSYGSSVDMRRRQEQKLKSKERKIKWMIFSACLVVGLLWFAWESKKNQEYAQERGESLLQQARENLKIGLYEKSDDYFKLAKRKIKLNSSDLIKSVSLQLYLGLSPLEARRDLELIQGQIDMATAREKNILYAISYLKEQRWNDATVSLSEVLSQQPQDNEALHNFALLEFYRGHHTSSLKLIEQLRSHSYQNSELSLLQGFLHIAQSTNYKGSQQQISQLKTILMSELKQSFDYRFEKMLILSYLNFSAGDSEQAESLLGQIWIFDPFESKNFLQNLFLDHQLLKDERWGYLCQKVSHLTKSAEVAIAINAICFAQQSGWGPALQYIVEERKKISKSTRLTSLQALMLFYSQQKTEAFALVKLSENEYHSKIVTGLNCTAEKKWDCAEKIWMDLAQLSPVAPQTLNGLATLMKQRGNESAYQDMIRRGLVMAPLYQPFVEARGGIQ